MGFLQGDQRHSSGMDDTPSLKGTIAIKLLLKDSCFLQYTGQKCRRYLLEFCGEDLGVLRAVVSAIRNAIIIVVALAVVADAISVSVALTAVRDERAVVARVGDAVAIGIRVANIPTAVIVAVALVTVGDAWAVVQVILDAITVEYNSKNWYAKGTAGYKLVSKRYSRVQIGMHKVQPGTNWYAKSTTGYKLVCKRKDKYSR